MTEPIWGKVASVLTEHEVALNIGSNHGVGEGMKFEILSNPVPITDPDSGKKIGEVTISKAEVKAYEVHPEYSLARTYGTVGAVPYPTLFPTRVIRELPVDKSDLLYTKEKVRVGDLVRQIKET